MINNMNITSYTKQKYVAMLDIMGFKAIVGGKTAKNIYDLLNEVYREAMRQQDFKNIKITIFSDTIMIISNDDSIDSYSDVVVSSAFFVNLFIKKGFAINGAIAFGDITFDKNKNICFGQPIIDAHLLQEDLFFYGIVLHESANKKRYAEDQGMPPYSLVRPDLVINLKIPLKSKGWEEMYCVNWCEFFVKGRNPCHQAQIPEIKKCIEKLYEQFKSSGRGIFYIQNTEIVLKQWYDFGAKTNGNYEGWEELISGRVVTNCPSYDSII